MTPAMLTATAQRDTPVHAVQFASLAKALQHISQYEVAP
jgi:hypothetical protein